MAFDVWIQCAKPFEISGPLLYWTPKKEAQKKKMWTICATIEYIGSVSSGSYHANRNQNVWTQVKFLVIWKKRRKNHFVRKHVKIRLSPKHSLRIEIVFFRFCQSNKFSFGWKIIFLITPRIYQLRHVHFQWTLIHKSQGILLEVYLWCICTGKQIWYFGMFHMCIYVTQWSTKYVLIFYKS